MDHLTLPQSSRTATDGLLGRTVLGNYVVDKKLGEGGMGAVYRLRHVRLPDTWAALKVMIGAESRDMQARFEQEAMVAAAIGGQRVARPIDLGQFEDGTTYIVMEYVIGKSLGEALAEDGPFAVADALRIAAGVAETLVIAHDKGIVHRDIKPPNIMLPAGTKDGTIKLLDFGVARATGGLKLAQTAQNSIVGTPGYMSPETCTGAEIDGRADVFSLGAVLFEMLVGEVPFFADTIVGIMTRTMTDEVPSIAAKRAAGLDLVPAEVVALVERVLAKKAADRLTMLEFHQSLASALDRVSRHPAVRGTIKHPAPPPPKEAESAPTRVSISESDTIDESFGRRARLRMAMAVAVGAAVVVGALIALFVRHTIAPMVERQQPASPPTSGARPPQASTAVMLSPTVAPVSATLTPPNTGGDAGAQRRLPLPRQAAPPGGSRPTTRKKSNPDDDELK